jgi:tRNA threonylcarbamoyl adenosine modification protein YjeE
VIVDQAGLEAWGRRLGESLEPPAFLGLSGDLGAGKSVLARAIARGAGVDALMPSPTFNLVFRYEARRGVTVVHLDLYRLERADEVWNLGWRELGERDEIVLVEWPERAGDLLPPDHWEIRLRDAGQELRNVELIRHGAPPALPGVPPDVPPAGA